MALTNQAWNYRTFGILIRNYFGKFICGFIPSKKEKKKLPMCMILCKVFILKKLYIQSYTLAIIRNLNVIKIWKHWVNHLMCLLCQIGRIYIHISLSNKLTNRILQNNYLYSFQCWCCCIIVILETVVTTNLKPRWQWNLFDKGFLMNQIIFQITLYNRYRFTAELTYFK